MATKPSGPSKWVRQSPGVYKDQYGNVLKGQKDKPTKDMQPKKEKKKEKEKEKPAKKPKEPPTTDDAFLQGIGSALGDDEEMRNAITAGIAFGQKLAQDLLNTRLPETLPQALTDLQNDARARYEESGKIDTYTQAAIDALSKELETAGQISPAQQEALDIAKKGLGGYTSPELQAQREEALSSVLQQAETGTEATIRKLGARNIQGGVAGRVTGNIALQAAIARGDLERKLLAENADVQDRRLAAYTGAVNTAQGQAQQYRQGVLGAFADVNVRTGQNLSERRQNAFNALSDVTGRNESYLNDVRQTNANVARAALAARYETPLGWGQLYAANRGAKEEREIARIAAERAGAMPPFGLPPMPAEAGYDEGADVGPGGGGAGVVQGAPSGTIGPPPPNTPIANQTKEQLAASIEQARRREAEARKKFKGSNAQWILDKQAQSLRAQEAAFRKEYERMYGKYEPPKVTTKSLQLTSPGTQGSFRTTL